MDCPVRTCRLLLPILLLLIPATPGLAQQRAADPEPAPASRGEQAVRVQGGEAGEGAIEAEAREPGAANMGREGLADLLKNANPMLWPLVLCSVVTLGFALERLIALRRERILPREFVSRFLERLASGKLDRDRATELCRANDSPAAHLFGRVVHFWGRPAAEIRDAVAHDGAGEILEMKRHARVLNGTATLGPLLGLFGTVVGLIEAFDALGARTDSGINKSEALAHGISLALLATAFGLLIAIASVIIYYYLLNRIDILARALDQHVSQVIDLVSGDSGRPIADRRPVAGPSEMVRQ